LLLQGGVHLNLLHLCCCVVLFALQSRDVKHAEQISKLQARLQEAEERRAELHGQVCWSICMCSGHAHDSFTSPGSHFQQVVKLKDVLASRSHAAGQPRYPILRTLSTVPVERWTKQQRHEMISLLLTPRAEDEATLSTALADVGPRLLTWPQQLAVPSLRVATCTHARYKYSRKPCVCVSVRGS